jgi:hypothetical protein
MNRFFHREDYRFSHRPRIPCITVKLAQFQGSRQNRMNNRFPISMNRFFHREEYRFSYHPSLRILRITVKLAQAPETSNKRRRQRQRIRIYESSTETESGSHSISDISRRAAKTATIPPAPTNAHQMDHQQECHDNTRKLREQLQHAPQVPHLPTLNA